MRRFFILSSIMVGVMLVAFFARPNGTFTTSAAPRLQATAQPTAAQATAPAAATAVQATAAATAAQATAPAATAAATAAQATAPAATAAATPTTPQTLPRTGGEVGLLWPLLVLSLLILVLGAFAATRARRS